MSRGAGITGLELQTVSEGNPFQKPSQLRDVLTRLIRRKGLVETSAADQLNVVWNQIVGDEIGRRSSARKIRGGVLEVVVTNTVALEQLRGYLNQSILEKLQSVLPESNIRSIRYIRRG